MNRRHLLTTGAAAAATLLPLVATGALAQESAMMADGTMDPAKAPAILNGNFAKATSQLAAERATSDAVRQFAELEVAEQTAVATAFGVPADAPLAIPEAKAAMLADLEAAEGAAFDVMYIDGQIAGHEELRGIHASYAESGSDPMARGASLVGVTGIDTHLVMLRSIRASLGA
jgi:putative membrane protein